MRFADLLLILRGATSGEQIIKAAAAASGAITLPAGTTDFSATTGVVQQATTGAPFTVGPVTAVAGTGTNDNAAAGNVGEYVVSNITTAVSVTTSSTAQNLTTISLTAGDWDVSGAINFFAAATTQISRTLASISTTSLNTSNSDFSTCSISSHAITYATGTYVTETVTPIRLSLAAPATVYLTLFCTFTVSTCTALGILRARRVR